METPDWLPKDEWAGFLEMRKKTRKPMTERAISLAFKSLEKLREEGQSVAAVLDQSTMNNWMGLFAVVERRSNDRREQPGRANFAALGKHGQVTANNLQEWLEESQ